MDLKTAAGWISGWPPPKTKTVGEFRELCRERGGDAGYLHADLRAGHIKIG